MRLTARHRRARHRRGAIQPITGLAAAAAALPLLVAPTAGAAGVIPEGPLTVRTISPIGGGYINDTLQGVVCQSPNTCTPVPYLTFWTPAGIAALDDAIDSADEPIVVFAYSNGAQVAQRWLAQHADDADAPAPDQVSFILMGNSTRKYGGIDSEFGVSQPTQYHVVDIAREYDPVADFPDDPFNLLAVANAYSGSITMHDYRDVDINDPDNIVWTEGNTTYVLVPTDNLPLLDPLRMVGLTALADQLNGPLKERVDQGYDRSYIPAEALETSDPTAVSAATEPAVPQAAPEPAAVSVSAATSERADDPEPVEVETVEESGDTEKSDTASRPTRHRLADTVDTVTEAATETLRDVSETVRSTLRSPTKRTTDSDNDSDSSGKDSSAKRSATDSDE